MPIKSIRIQNFQPLKDVDIDLGRITVLIGPTDLGKSSIIRAARALHRNQSNPSFVRHGASKFKITQVNEDGTTVSIEKGKGVNRFHVDATPYDKPGQSVPAQVMDVLATNPLELDKDVSLDLNFACQFGSEPFLLTSPTSVITKTVSSLSGIHILYSAIREGNAESFRFNAKSKVLAETIENLLKYDQLSEDSCILQAEVTYLDAMQKDLDSLTSKVDVLRKMQSKLADLDERGIDPSSVVKDRSTLSTIMKTGIQEMENNLGLLVRLDSALKAVMAEDYSGLPDLKLGVRSLFALEQEFLEGLRNLDKFTELQKGLGLEKDLSQITKMVDTRTTLGTVLGLILDKQAELDSLQRLLSTSITNQVSLEYTDVMLRDFEEQVKDLQAKVSICPACGRSV